MTNDPLDEAESKLWRDGALRDRRFRAALRMDPLLNDWSVGARKIKAQGFDVSEQLSKRPLPKPGALDEWIGRMQPMLHGRFIAVHVPLPR